MKNIHENEGSKMAYSIGLAQIDQARRLLDKGYPITI